MGRKEAEVRGSEGFMRILGIALERRCWCGDDSFGSAKRIAATCSIWPWFGFLDALLDAKICWVIPI